MEKSTTLYVSYNVAIIRGWKILEKNIIGAKSLIKLKNQTLLFTHLDKNRSDIIVYERYRGYEIIQRLGIKGIVALEPPLVVRDMFLYLHKKHEKLIPQLSDKIKEMKKEGTFAKIVRETLKNK